jgi:hypothetical protein
VKNALMYRAIVVSLCLMGGLTMGADVPASAAAANSMTLWHSQEIKPPTNAAASPVVTLDAIACASPGSCDSGGSYETKSGAFESMVAAQSKGSWTQARELRLPSNAFAANPDSSVSSVSCPAVGSCVAVGNYTYDSAGNQYGFTAVESGGKWPRARQVPVPANAVKHMSNAQLGAVTCTGSDSCIAVGGYLDNAGGFELMAVVESHGHWGNAHEIAPPQGAAQNPGASLDGVFCRRAGDCSAVGSYTDTKTHVQALAVTESGGHWERAVKIAAPSNAGPNPGAELTAVSCGSASACSAVGQYFDSSAAVHAMAVSESKQGWAHSKEIRPPHASGFEAGGLTGVSCAAAGSCEAVGSYILNFAAVPMAVTESAGRWQPAVNVLPPANALTGMFRDATLLSVDCVIGHACIAVGWYVDKSKHQQAMAATRPTP